jgi:multiple sugar transport system substrate-binding protein
MSAESENKEAAWEFIKFWTNENANKVRIDYELPVLKNVVAEEGLDEDEVKSVFYNMLERSESYTPTSFKVDNWSTLSEDLNLVFEEIFNPTTRTEPKEALEAIIK